MLKPKKPTKTAPWTQEKRDSAAIKSRQNWRKDATRSKILQGRNMKQVWTAVRQLRIWLTEERQWSQADFAEALGLSRKSQTHISSLENGTRKPTEKLKTRMAEIAHENGLDWHYWE